MRIALRALLIATVCVAACGTTPSARLYTLGADATEADRVATDKRRIEIVAVRIPDLWDRPQMVLTKSANEVSFNEFHRWASPLRAEIPRVVVRNLTRLLDDQTIWLREDFAGARPDLRVQVTIERIEAIAGERVQFDAAWVVRAVEGEATRVGRAAIVEKPADASYDAVVSATRRALLGLSVAVAQDINALPKGSGGK